ncbi:Ail/Lom family outer membrane beta-barrel protein [Vibrio sp. 10N.261.46.E12]|uniref:Ail/Lom family outer membrane beta-barrel protein n=1 Tax=unclassified Vibrio TaxID=2614977 RepID=UPI000975C7C2|nr:MULTISPECIES: Ail/Lom family outer membrane beta-barrel protein [unclassified Vibrio]OMO36079.1 hypothetical protein BH584_04710 [Vibrio sp. 10N.261.45.E1]PMJ34569.1 hypothetical protein BCU27_03825 [Vibrio sp. 10N.286.45.B6]PML88097.1 hypothetical protein BCT66_10895 [Vibrio sp. 10N.261.49.E11]PMM67425.1 hypothetical protein BCT48_15370 [Vibrio sp. 10N.261.46.F12]PMM81692.1 hypothetical protein BCT46_14890 [Vibrio sp. 10N.261.46.E8]
MKKASLITLIAATTFASNTVHADSITSRDVESLSTQDFFSIYLNSTDLGNGLEASGFGVRMGLNVDGNWGVVASAGVLGDIGSVNYQGENVDTDITGWELSIGPSYYVNDWLSVFATAGVVNLDTSSWTLGDPYTTQVFKPEFHQLVDVVNRDRENSSNNKNTSFKYGIGVNMFVTDRFVVNATYHRFDAEVTLLGNTVNSDADQLSIGFGFRF